MVVQHNLQAMNANRQLNITTGAQGKSTEKLSSGYKINRAADDAAGLSISEKMRRQIRGLDRASTNAQDGISSVQTAEGALNEVHDMLQRMNELANQASNGTNSASDRQSIQDEISQLNTEIDRVAETTKFNETYLLKGDAGTKEITMKGHDAGLKGSFSDSSSSAKFEVTLTTDSDISITSHNYHIYDTDDMVSNVQSKVDNATEVMINGTTYKKSGVGAVSAAQLKSSALMQTCAAAIKTQSMSQFQKSIALKQVSIAKITSKVNVRAASIETIKASAAKFLEKAAAATDEVSAAQLKSSALQQTCAAAIKTKSMSQFQKSIALKQVSIAKITSNVNGRAASIETIKASAATLQKKADGGFESDGKVYTANEVKAKIVDGAKVGIDGVKSRTAVDPKNNSNNKTMASIKALIKNTLKQANQIGVDDETKVDVSDPSQDGDKYTYTIQKGTATVAKEKSFELHVGADADLTNKITVNIETMNSKYLGVQDLNVVDDTGVAATLAIDAIEDAISKVSEQRSELGAVQNRLEHTINNLDNVAENTQSAESSIRDTDIADEMVRYSKNNILSQAGQSMLAQANQSTQGALSLLG